MTAPRQPGRSGISPKEADSLAERVHRQREQLFNADSILTACHNALATKYEVKDPEYMAPALLAAANIVDVAAGELGDIVDALRGDMCELLPDSGQPKPQRRGAKGRRKARQARRT